MATKQSKCYSGIGGQAVLEGIMMKNKDKYAVAVRKPDGEIAVDVEEYQDGRNMAGARTIPFIRGIFNFVDSLVLGMKCLNYSASFYEEEANEPTDPKKEKLLSGFVTMLSVSLAVGLFIVLPYYLSSLCRESVRNTSLLAIIEGVIRLGIFLLYVVGISLMKDIRRLYRYHGAEHKCINCIERGRPLAVDNVMRSSRLHKRCGTSFIFFVLIVSIILFFFIRVENPVERVMLRILLMPVVAGISYEIIRLAGKSDNILIRIISAPGMLIQRLTTKEPDEDMVKVAIVAVEAVFDWKAFLQEHYGYEDTALKENRADDAVRAEEETEPVDGQPKEEA